MREEEENGRILFQLFLAKIESSPRILKPKGLQPWCNYLQIIVKTVLLVLKYPAKNRVHCISLPEDVAARRQTVAQLLCAESLSRLHRTECCQRCTNSVLREEEENDRKFERTTKVCPSAAAAKRLPQPTPKLWISSYSTAVIVKIVDCNTEWLLLFW